MRELKLLEVFTRAANIMKWVIVDAAAASEVIVDAVGGLAADVGVVGSVVA